MRITLFGIPVDVVDMAGALARIQALVTGFRQDAIPRYVATVNVDFVVNAIGWSLRSPRHPELLQTLQAADLVTADGFPLVRASHWLGGVPLPCRVAGADLVPQLAALAAEQGWRLYFLGGAGDSAWAAADVLCQRHPSLQVVGCDTAQVSLPTAAGEADAATLAILARMHEARPDILLLGLGNPKQELWFNRVRQRLHVPVTIGVGGTFSFIAGRTRRAPRWVQRCGLEWCHRLCQEPRRLLWRYTRDAIVFSWLLMSAFVRRWRGSDT